MKYTQLLFLCFVFLSSPLLSQDASKKTISSSTSSDKSFADFQSYVTNLYEREQKHSPDVIRKTQECIDLVNKAITHLEAVDMEIACRSFIYDEAWRKGEIVISIIDDQGYILCYGNYEHLVWKNTELFSTYAGLPVLPNLRKASEDGTWVNYKFNNGYKTSYVRKIKYKDDIYYVGAGFFPQDKDFIAKNLLTSAIEYFHQVPAQVAFSRISNPQDTFVIGDVSLYVSDFKGNMVASSFNTSFFGQNVLNYKDSKGVSPVKVIIDTIKDKKTMKFQYEFLKLAQENYIEYVQDDLTGSDYFFVGNYHPEENDPRALALLDEAVTYLKTVGSRKALEEFSSIQSKFVKGNMYLFAYDFNGVNLANMQYPLLVGKNLINRKDKAGKKYVQEIINIAQKKGFGLVATFDKNSVEKLFFITVNTPEGKIILGVSLYTQEKSFVTEWLIEKAARLIKEQSLAGACQEFSKSTGSFLMGDMYLTIYDHKGISLVNGSFINTIWKAKADNNQQYNTLNAILEKAQSGEGWIESVLDNGIKRIYVKPFYVMSSDNKKKDLFILTSGYFL